MDWNERGQNTGKGDLRLVDIWTFLSMYDLVKDREKTGELYATYQELSQDLKTGDRELNLVTALQRLARVASAFCGEPLPPKKAAQKLFTRSKKAHQVQATPLADELQRWLRTITDVYERAAESARTMIRGQTGPPEVRIGSVQSLGLSALPFLLSRWQECFGGRVKLRPVEIANSGELVQRLAVGALDCVFAFGTPDAVTSSEDERLSLSFEPLGLMVSTVLLAHPEGNVWATTGEDLNKGYWDQLQRSRRRKRRLVLTDYKEIQLEDVAFERTNLIAVSSWRLPSRLFDNIKESRKFTGAFQVDTFEEAIAHVQMNQGVAPVIQVFARRRDVTVFRLNPNEAYMRSASVFYRSSPDGVPPAVRILIDFLKAYFQNERIQGKIWDNEEAPGFDDQDYRKLCDEFEKNARWDLLNRSTGNKE